jgi:hypothetical protein
MRLFLISISLLLFASASIAQKDTSSVQKERLRNLLKDRKEKFSQYDKALENHSGIFGNQTKKDIKNANQVLEEIVRTDNRIMNELSRLLDYKSFEKTNYNYTINNNSDRIEKQARAIEILQQQLKKEKARNSELQKEMDRKQLILYFLLVVAIAISLWLFMKRKRKLNT